MHELARKVTLTCVYRTVDGATAVHVEARSAVVLPSLLLGARGPGFRERHGVQPGVYTPADPGAPIGCNGCTARGMRTGSGAAMHHRT